MQKDKNYVKLEIVDYIIEFRIMKIFKEVKKMKKIKIVLTIILVLYILTTIVIFLGENGFILRKNAVTTKGIVVYSSDVTNYGRHRGQGGRFWAIQYGKDIAIQYSDKDGNIYTEHKRMISYVDPSSPTGLESKYLQDSEITITYDKTNPTNVRIGELAPFFNIYNILLCIGLIIYIVIYVFLMIKLK